jgi:6-phosphogluconolactonase (cycloisomerase 2 family)
MKISYTSLITLLATTALSEPIPAALSDGYQKCRQASNEVGAVFAMTNAPGTDGGNRVVGFSRNGQGKLTQTGVYPTGGDGQGVDFDSTGGLELSDDNRFLYACSPSSDLITVFEVHGSCLTKVQEIYGGDQPVGITLHGNLAYVLDQSVATTGIFGFHVSSNGRLSPINNETIPTSTLIGVPGEVLFHPDGNSVIVTNKVGSTIDYYSIGDDGMATLVTTTASNGLRPFSADYNSNGTLFILESGLPVLTNAAVSTYSVSDDGALSVISRSVKNQQTDGCWILVTNDDAYAYTANFVSASLSSYKVDGSSVTLIDGVAADQGNGSNPVDLALSSDSKYLYNLLRGFGTISGHEIQSDGSLKSVGVFGKGGPIPVNNGASGLAAY